MANIDKTNLLDPPAIDDRSDYEKKVVEDAIDAGKGLESTVPGSGDEHVLGLHNTGGAFEQTINSKAVEGFGQPGGESDISGGIPNLDETTGKIVDENEYNR